MILEIFLLTFHFPWMLMQWDPESNFLMVNSEKLEDWEKNIFEKIVPALLEIWQLSHTFFETLEKQKSEFQVFTC